MKLVVSRDLKRNLKRLSEISRREVMEKALSAGAEVIAEEARSLVPVRTGNLRDSIGVSTETINLSAGQFGRGDVQVFVGPRQGKGEPNNGFYGHMIEFGTAHSPPHPFMRPAFDTKGKQAAEVAVAHLRIEFNRATKG